MNVSDTCDLYRDILDQYVMRLGLRNDHLDLLHMIGGDADDLAGLRAALQSAMTPHWEKRTERGMQRRLREIDALCDIDLPAMGWTRK